MRTARAIAISSPTTLLAPLLVIAGVLLMPWDVQLASWFCADGTPGELRAIFARAELFGHAYGVMAIGVTVYLLDPKRRQDLKQLVVLAALAGLSAGLIKMSIWRIRPRSWLEGAEFHRAGDATGSGLVTFFGSLPGALLAGKHSVWQSLQTAVESSHHSFPSGHAAMGFGVAALLARWYPRGKTWFFVLAFLCAMNRVDGGAHYASDVCWGAALGLVAFEVTQRLYARPDRRLTLRLRRPSGRLNRSAEHSTA